MMNVFDPASIGDEAIRAHYLRILRRGDAMASTMARDFPNKPPVRFIITEDQMFNAFAGPDEEGYLLEVAKPVPYLLLILFDRLLSDPRLLPWLESNDEAFTEYKLPFVLDPACFAKRDTWSVRLTSIRSFAASMLADIAIAFVQMHELGHVMCGHADAYRALTGRRAMAEIISHAPRNRSQRALERAWEADADSVAVGLLEHYLHQLVHVTQQDEQAHEVFGHESTLVEHVLSLAIVSLYAMFAYMRGVRYALRRDTNHPHPYVRARYVKNMLVTVARRAWPLDLDAFSELLDTRLDEMLVVLESVGLSRNELFDDAYIARSDRELEDVIKIRAKYRNSCVKWAWISWD